jgi:ankyrin repeat protein
MLKKLIILFLIVISIRAHNIKQNDLNLIKYSYIGDIKKVSILIKGGSNINTNYNNLTPLLQATFKNHTDIAKLLIKNGANINSKSTSGKDILYYAVQNNNIEFVKYLLNIGMKQLAINNSHDILFKAVQKGYIDIVKLIVPLFKDLNKYYTVDDYDTNHNSVKTTLLITAIQNDHLDIAKLLIKNGANINKVNSKDESPILTSMRNKYFDFARYLIDVRANLKTQDIGGNNTLTYAITSKQEDIALKSIQHIDIHQWVDSKIFEGGFSLYEHYIYKNEKDNQFASYLHLASRYGQTRVIEELLKKKLNIEQESKDNRYLYTSLDYAVLFSDVKTVKFLIDFGANPFKNYQGSIIGESYYTLLSLALVSINKAKNKKEIVQYLLTLPSAFWYVQNENSNFYYSLLKLKDKTTKKSVYNKILNFMDKHNFKDKDKLRKQYNHYHPKKTKITKKSKEITLDEELEKTIKTKDIKHLLYLTRKNDKKLLSIVKKLNKKTNLNAYNFLYQYVDDRETEVDYKILKELVKLNLKFHNLKQIYNLYSNSVFELILSDDMFKQNILKLHQNNDITNIAIGIYKNKRRTNHRIEMMLELIYKYKLKFDFDKFEKVINKDDKYINKLVWIYNTGEN